MSTSTTHLHLVKPDYVDKSNVAVLNSNMDTLDSAIYDLQTRVVYALTVDMGTITSLPVEKTAEGITADMKVYGYEIGDMTAFASDLTVVTSTGSITVSGTMRTGGSSTLKIRLMNNLDVTATAEGGGS